MHSHSVCVTAAVIAAWMCDCCHNRDAVVRADELGFGPHQKRANSLIKTLPTVIAKPRALFPEENPDVRQEIALTLLNENKQPLSAILMLLECSPRTAEYFTPYLGPDSCARLFPVLLKSLKSSEEEGRDNAAALLNALPYIPVAAEQSLLELLYERHPSVRCQALKLLGRIKSKDSRILDRIQYLTAHESPQVRCSAIEAIRELGAIQYLEDVRTRLTDQDFDVRLAAAFTIAFLDPDDQRCVELFGELYAEAADDEKERIFQHLTELGSRAIVFKDVWKHQIRAARELTSLSRDLDNAGPAAVNILMELLVDTESEDTRWSALFLLQKTRHDTSVARPGVIKCLHEESPRLQLQALSTMPLIEGFRVQDATPFLKRSDSFRLVVAEILASCKAENREEAIEVLRQLLDNEQVKVQLQAYNSLARLNASEPQDLKQLTLLLASSKDIGVDTTTRVIAALKQSGPDAVMAIPLLISLLGDSKLSARAAADALVAIGEPAVPRLITALNNKNINISRRAEESLTKIKGPRAAEALAERLWEVTTNPELRPAEFPVGDESPNDALLDAKINKRRADSLVAIRLASLLQSPEFSEKALAALADLGPQAVPAIPELQRYYKRLCEVEEDWVRAWPSIQCAKCMYEIDSALSKPLETEIDRTLLMCASASHFSPLGEEAVHFALKLNYCPEHVVAELKRLALESDFVSPEQRAFHFYSLARFEPSNPQWLDGLRLLASTKRNGAKAATRYLELVGQRAVGIQPVAK